ncbi:MAG: hypothetical protein ACJAVI_004793 [Candidatus Azotimanducaceae bacterium]|jgi:hypothetical protein
MDPPVARKPELFRLANSQLENLDPPPDFRTIQGKDRERNTNNLNFSRAVLNCFYQPFQQSGF